MNRRNMIKGIVGAGAVAAAPAAQADGYFTRRWTDQQYEALLNKYWEQNALISNLQAQLALIPKNHRIYTPPTGKRYMTWRDIPSDYTTPYDKP